MPMASESTALAQAKSGHCVPPPVPRQTVIRERRPDSRRCTDCALTKPLDGFIRFVASRTGYYGACRVCCNRRARERYHSAPAVRQAEIERAKRNNRRRAAERSVATDEQDC